MLKIMCIHLHIFLCVDALIVKKYFKLKGHTDKQKLLITISTAHHGVPRNIYLVIVLSFWCQPQLFFALKFPWCQPPKRKKKILVEINNTIASMDATLVIVVSAALLEKLPNTYPITNTIHATNNTLIKMISPKGIVLNF